MALKWQKYDQFSTNIAFAGLIICLSLAFFHSTWFFIPSLILAYFTWAPKLWEIRSQRRVLLSTASTQDPETFRALFGMLARFIVSDGDRSRGKVRILNRFIRKELRLSRKQSSKVKRIVRDAVEGNLLFSDYLETFFSSVEENAYVGSATFELLFRLATTDGPITEEAEKMLETARLHFGIDKAVYEALLAGFGAGDRKETASSKRTRQKVERLKNRTVEHSVNDSPPPEPPETLDSNPLEKEYRLLGCLASVSDDEVKKRFRVIAKQCHPDSLRAQGLPEPIINNATEQFKAISLAYHSVMESRAA